MTRPAVAKLDSRNWFGKVSAAVLLGFTLSLALVGVFDFATPGGLPGGDTKTQLSMWLVSPIWCAIVSFCFFFRNGLRAWLWLGGANILAWGVVLASRALS